MKGLKTFAALLAAFALAGSLASCKADDDGVISAPTKSAPNAVGDIVLNDGTAVAAANMSLMSDAQKSRAVALIFYASTDSGAALGAKVLGMGVRTSFDDSVTIMKWAASDANGYNVRITPLNCAYASSGSVLDGTLAYSFDGDTDGSDNYAALKTFLAQTEDLSDDTGTSGKYPAFEWVNAYAENHSLTGEWASGWYLPTAAELYQVRKNGSVSISKVLETLGGKGLPYLLGDYWSSTQAYTSDAIRGDEDFAVTISPYGNPAPIKKDRENYVLAIRKF